MKILISVSYYVPHISGLTNSVKNLAELLGKNGYEVTILTTQHIKGLSLKEKINNVTVKRIPYLFNIHKGFFMPQFIFSTYNTLKDSDQVIISLPQMEGFLLAVLAKIMRKRIHCIYVCDVTFGKGFLSKVIGQALSVSNALSLRLADNVITLTDDFRKTMPILDSLASEIHVIDPVIIEPVINQKVKEAIAERLPQKTYYVGFIGRIAAEKGIEYLLETIPALRRDLGDNFVLVLAGPLQTVGEGAYAKRIDAEISQNKEHVVQLGELQDSELGAFYANLDVLVLPSINSTEAFGMVQVEAMLCGTPVVASDLPGVRTPIVRTGMGEISKVKDSVDLAEKIIKVLKNKKLYIKKREIVREHFSASKILSQYRRLLSSS